MVDGVEAEVMAEVAGHLKYFAIAASPEQAALPLQTWLKSGDVVLLKGSRAIALERLIPLLPNV